MSELITNPAHTALSEMRAKNKQLSELTKELLEVLQSITDDYAKAMIDSGVTRYPEALTVVREARAAIAKALGGDK